MTMLTKLPFALISAALLASCSHKPEQVGPAAPEVRVIIITPKDVPVVKEGVATLTGFVNANISPRVSGHIISQNYREGSVVKKGDLLFQLDPRPFEDALAQARAKLSRDEATKAKAEEDQKRFLELFAKGAISAQDLGTAVQNAKTSNADTQADIAAVKDAELNLAYTTITAPIDGVAGFANAQVGDLVNPNSGPLTTVSQVDPIKAIVSSGEQSYTELVTKHPDAAERDSYLTTLDFALLLSNGSSYPHRGKYYAMDRNVDPKTGAIRHEVIFPNPGNILRPGQFGRVRVTVETKQGALVVPQEAVTELQGSYQVAVVEQNNRVAIRPVKMGQRFGELWEVTEGLNPGDKVIVQGLQKARPGSAVAVKSWIPRAEPIALASSDQRKEP
jgi:membrane fusion protein, multidrug efflux system